MILAYTVNVIIFNPNKNETNKVRKTYSSNSKFLNKYGSSIFWSESLYYLNEESPLCSSPVNKVNQGGRV